MLLEPAQEGRQAGPAAERDDPRTAGEEALLVDDLDERPVLVVGSERVGQDADDLPRREREDGHADRRQDERPEPVRQGLEGDRRHDRLDRLAELDVAVDLAQDEGESEGQPELAQEDDDQPALDADARGEPAAESHGRWRGDDGVRSSGQRALELAMEDGHGAEVLLAQPGGELLGDRDRAMEPARATDPDREPGLALADVGRDDEGRGTRAGRRGTARWSAGRARTSGPRESAPTAPAARRCSTGSA